MPAWLGGGFVLGAPDFLGRWPAQKGDGPEKQGNTNDEAMSVDSVAVGA
jgi:hypothetical protein